MKDKNALNALILMSDVRHGESPHTGGQAVPPADLMFLFLRYWFPRNHDPTYTRRAGAGRYCGKEEVKRKN
jgi:hypothetical protein